MATKRGFGDLSTKKVAMGATVAKDTEIEKIKQNVESAFDAAPYKKHTFKISAKKLTEKQLVEGVMNPLEEMGFYAHYRSLDSNGKHVLEVEPKPDNLADRDIYHEAAQETKKQTAIYASRTKKGKATPKRPKTATV
jgi:hypothetical protein